MLIRKMIMEGSMIYLQGLQGSERTLIGCSSNQRLNRIRIANYRHLTRQLKRKSKRRRKRKRLRTTALPLLKATPPMKSRNP